MKLRETTPPVNLLQGNTKAFGKLLELNAHFYTKWAEGRINAPRLSSGYMNSTAIAKSRLGIGS